MTRLVITFRGKRYTVHGKRELYGAACEISLRARGSVDITPYSTVDEMVYDIQGAGATVEQVEGYDGHYSTRHYAKKDAWRDEHIVKVDGGYVIMSASEYQDWRKQK